MDAGAGGPAETDGPGDNAFEREVDRLSSDILDGKVPSADAPFQPPLDAKPNPAQRAIEGAWVTGVLVAYDPRSGEKPAPGAPPDVKRHYGRAVAGVLTIGLVAFLAAFMVLQRDDPPGSGTTAVQAQATPAPTPSPTSPPTPTPAPTGTAATATPTPDAAITPAASTAPAATGTPQSVTLRGPIDTTAMSSSGLRVGQHDIELVVFLDNGTVTGSMTLAIEDFPIGALLTQAFGGMNDPDYATFKNCTTRMRLEGSVKGTYVAATGRMRGKIRVQPVSEDVHGCLDTRPPNVTMDSVVQPSTLAWSATLAGTKAKGKIGTKPASPFTATAED